MHASASDLKVKVEQVSATGVVLVSIQSAELVIKIWRDGSEWGSARWRIHHLVNGGGLRTYFVDPDRMYTVNMRAFHKVSADKPLQVKLDLNDGE